MPTFTTTIEDLLRNTGLPTRRLPTHPGVVIMEEFLRPMGITQVQAAREMGIPLARLNEIIKGKRGVTEETALILERYLGMSSLTWLQLQHNYDLANTIRSISMNRLRKIAPALTTVATVR